MKYGEITSLLGGVAISFVVMIGIILISVIIATISTGITYLIGRVMSKNKKWRKQVAINTGLISVILSSTYMSLQHLISLLYGSVSGIDVVSFIVFCIVTVSLDIIAVKLLLIKYNLEDNGGYIKSIVITVLSSIIIFISTLLVLYGLTVLLWEYGYSAIWDILRMILNDLI